VSAPSPTKTAPSWKQRLRDEELNGFAFAFKARSVALAIVVVWVILSASLNRLPILMGAAALFFAVGWVAYQSRKHRHMLVIQALCAVLDVAIIVLASHLPETDPYEWAIQTWMRRSTFLYLVAYVASSALTFSVIVVLVSGLAALAGQIATFLFVLYAAQHVDSFQGFASKNPYDLLRQLIAMQGVEPNVFMVNQIVLLAVTVGLIAAAIWRARRHVERAVMAETQRSNLGRYFSPNLVKRLAEAGPGLGAGRAQDATVMFVDIIGSTQQMEMFTPEQVIAGVRAVHRRVVPVVMNRGGTIDKFLGDGVMAVFGAPEGKPDDARQAVLAAVEILDMVDRWSLRRTARGNVSVHVAIGVHFGAVIQGNVGIEDRLEFTTLGDTVNVASRLQNMTRQHDTGILVSRAAIDAAERSAPLPPAIKARCRDLGPLPLVGHEALVDLVAIDREGAR
jgi:adenylate cyclase